MYSRRLTLMCLCAFGAGFLFTSILMTDRKTLQLKDGFQIFASSDNHRRPAFMINNRPNCPIRNISIMKKTKRAHFTRVGLLSFPGSGNTWTRHLIQQLTGLCTGTVYCDKFLSQNGFVGECIFPDNKLSGCIVYKSHQYKPTNHLKQFDKAVILIRNPFDAIKAYYNWNFGKSVSSSTNTTVRRPKAAPSPKDKFHAVVNVTRFNSKEWAIFVKKQCIEWQTKYTIWLKTFMGRSLIIRYDHLKKDLIPTLRRISHFLNVTTTDTDYTCTVANGEGQHHRKQIYELGVTDIYTENQIDTINSAIMSVMNVSRNKFGLKDFIFVNPY